MELKDVTAVVTGGASGLGAATVEALADAGARVAVWDLSAERGEALAARVGGLFSAVDVCDEDAVGGALAAAERALGPVRVLITCAGVPGAWKIAGKDGPHPLDAFRRVVDVNLTGVFNCARLAAQRMRELDPLPTAERGVIVMCSSIAAAEGQIGQTAYAASKAGIVGMTLPMARDLGRDGIRCVSIAPGIFETPMVATLPDEVRDAIAADMVFPHRLGQPAEFARLVLEVCGNVMLNGTTLRIDAGTRLKAR